MARRIFVSGPPRSGTTMLQAMLDPARAPECNYITTLIDNHYTYSTYKEKFRFEFYLKTDELATKTYRAMVECILGNIPVGTVLKDPQIMRVLPSAKKLFPDAVFIVTMRDPKDVAASMRVVYRKKKVSDAIGGIIEFMQPFFCDVPDGVAVVRYEDLCVRKPEVIAQLEAMCERRLHLNTWDFVGDTQDPFMSDYYGKPPTDSRIGNYRELLTRDEARLVDATFEAIVSRYHYENATA